MMKKTKYLLVLLAMASTKYHYAMASNMAWRGSVSLKNNYVFSSGTEIDNNPVIQFWANGQLPNGVYLDFWTNAPTEISNSRQSAEIDWGVGYVRQLKSSKLDVSFTYFDIEDSSLFDFEKDMWGPKIHWANKNIYTEAAYYSADQNRDGYLMGMGGQVSLSSRWSMTGKLNYVDGPYQNQEAVVSKLRFSHDDKQRFFDHIYIELSDLLYQNNPNDRRDFVVTLTLQKSLFTELD